jgi:hypothetical protein
MGTLLNRLLSITIVSILGTTALLGSGGAQAMSETGEPTVIACHIPHEFRYFARPNNCELFAIQFYPDGTVRRYRNVVARHLEWEGWGKSVAKARGKFSTAEPLTVVAFDRIHCSDGRWSYGRVTVEGLPGGGKGGFHLRLTRCGARQFSVNPSQFSYTY